MVTHIHIFSKKYSFNFLWGFLLLTTISCGAYVPLGCRCTWCYQCAGSCIPCLDSARVILPPRQPCGTLQFEIIRDIHGYRMYVSTISYVLADCCGSQNQVGFSVCVEDQQYDFDAYLFEGGQRALIPDDARDIIVGGLLADNCVTICIGIYTVDIPSQGFAWSWNRLIK